MSWVRTPLPTALLLALLWTGWRLVALHRTGFPEPVVQDEFAYLLGADTFAHARLANPPHPLGKFFESPMILVRPSYAPKYPPGQALFLALGQRLFGAPFFGVVISSALMLFSFSLMLFAWVPYPFALAVSGMMALCLQPGMYWTNSYWGGSVAACGGAFVLLAVGLYRGTRTPLAGAVFASGALLLFWTRPLEGGIFTLAVLAVFATELWSAIRPAALLAAILVLVPGAAWTGLYNRAVTGSPFHIPYLLYMQQYNIVPVLWPLPLLPEPSYSDPRLAAALGKTSTEMEEYQAHHPWMKGLERGVAVSLRRFLSALGVAVVLTMLIPVAWRDPRYRKMAIVTGVMLLTLTLETFHYKHYIAAVWAAQALMIAIWAHHAWTLRIRNLPVGAGLSVLVLLASPAVIAFQSEISLPRDWVHWRTEALQQLSARDRPQLLIVRYRSPEWAIGMEGVYNGADIDSQRVILAHDRGAEENRELVRYYPDRTISLLSFYYDSGQLRTKIEPYDSQ